MRAARICVVFYNLHGDGFQVHIIADARTVRSTILHDHAKVGQGDVVGVNAYTAKCRKGGFSFFAMEAVLL